MIINSFAGGKSGAVGLLLVLALAGCASRDLHPKSDPTLAEIARLPIAEIREFMPAEGWVNLSGRKVIRYVAMHAGIRSDSSVNLGAVFAAYPDATWNMVARGYGAQVKLHYSSATAAFLAHRAEVYVVFFEAESDGSNPVLIYGQEIGGDYQPAGGGLTVTGNKMKVPDIAPDRQPKYVAVEVFHQRND